MNQPNPERVYAVIASILERRYNIKIDYVVSKIEGGKPCEQNRD